MEQHSISTTSLPRTTISGFLVSKGVLQCKCACGGTPGPTGECALCK
jgi:hypothetical protein